MKKLSPRPRKRPLSRIAGTVLAAAVATTLAACDEVGYVPLPDPEAEPGIDAGNEDAGAGDVDSGVSNDAGIEGGDAGDGG